MNSPGCAKRPSAFPPAPELASPPLSALSAFDVCPSIRPSSLWHTDKWIMALWSLSFRRRFCFGGLQSDQARVCVAHEQRSVTPAAVQLVDGVTETNAAAQRVTEITFDSASASSLA